jgi:anti-anti-sigma factor
MKYSLSQNREILVVTLSGDLTRSHSRSMAELVHEVERADTRAVVLDLEDVGEIDHAQIPVFARLQAVVRRKEARLRVCALRPSLGLVLSELGVIQPEELQPDLKAALLNLVLGTGQAGETEL